MKKFVFPLLITSLLLTSCGYKGTHVLYKNGDLAFYDSDNFLIELETASEVNRVIESGDSVAIYYYLNGCSSCEEVEASLTNYIKDSKQQIYWMDFAKVPFYTVSGSSLSLDLSTLYIFDDGEIVKSYTKDSLDNSKMVKNNLRKVFKDSNSYIFNNVTNFTEYLTYYSGDAYVIDRTSKDAMDYYNNNVKNTLGNKNAAIFYLDTLIGNNPLIEMYGIQANYTFTHLTFEKGSTTIVDNLANPIY